jgi:hypothetical protein
MCTHRISNYIIFIFHQSFTKYRSLVVKGHNLCVLCRATSWSWWHDRLDFRLRISRCGVRIRGSLVTDILSRDETDVKLGFLSSTDHCNKAMAHTIMGQELIYLRIYRPVLYLSLLGNWGGRRLDGKNLTSVSRAIDATLSL